MLSCRRSAELISRGLDARMSGPQRLGLALHVSMCRHCSTYRQQLSQLREVLQRGMEELPELTALRGFTLRDEDRERLNRALTGSSGG